MTVHLGDNPIQRMAERLKHQERWKEAWAYPCPSCGSQPGEPCYLIMHAAVPSWSPHTRRRAKIGEENYRD